MTTQLPGDDAAPLDGLDKDRWAAVKAQVGALAHAAADGSLDDETLTGGLAALTQVPLDMDKVLNAVHVPDDADVYATGLQRMLRRIPDGWGRWVRCDAGWYPMLVELDEQLSMLLPEYEIHQMKEKYGTLRFYWGMPERIPACCVQRRKDDPRPLAEPVPAHLDPADRTPEAQASMDAWFQREVEHLDSEAHDACLEQLLNGPDAERYSAAVAQAEALVSEAERRSAITCERCGAPGSLHADGFWVKTLCSACAEQLEYAAVHDDDDAADE